MEDEHEHYKISSDKLDLVSAAASMERNRVRAIIMYPWPDKDVHQQWLDEAEPEEIANWVVHVDAQEKAESRQ